MLNKVNVGIALHKFHGKIFQHFGLNTEDKNKSYKTI